jgi:hypothetical protein
LLVTIPPLQMSKSVAAHVSHAKQLSQGIDLAEFPEFILKKITADYGIWRMANSGERTRLACWRSRPRDRELF